MRRWIALIALMALAIGVMPVQAEPDTDPARVHIDLYRSIRSSIVGVRGYGGGGTGTIIHKDGLVLTAHVITGGTGRVQVTLHGGISVDASIQSVNKELGISILQLPDDHAPYQALPIGDSGGLRTGERLYTVGDTFGSIFNDHTPSLSVGVLSGEYEITKGKRRYPYTGPVYETTAAINPGMDGAPALNRKGQLVGMCTLNYTDETWSNLFLPINLMLADLADAGLDVKVEQPKGPGYLGVVAAKTAWGNDGIVVENVHRFSPAEEHGIEPGDVILTVNGKAVDSPDEFYERLKGLSAGSQVIFELKRSGERQEVVAEMGRLPY